MVRHSVESGLFVRRYGAGTAPDGVIVYIHGLGESGLCFRGLADHKRLRRWAHVVPDLQGYGRSAWGADPASLAEQARMLAGWIGAHLKRRFVLLGHSMGGVLGAMLCELPEVQARIKAFVNVEGNVSADDCHYSGKVASLSLDRFEAQGWPDLLDEVYRGGVDDDPLRGYYAGLRLCDPRAFRLNSKELVGLSDSGALARRYGGLPQPQIYIYGAPRGTGAESRSQLEGAGVRCLGISGAGHWPFADQPSSFIDGLASFFATCAVEGRTR
jgi:pimeloyl-ACP methyl ester carboxylesterase